VLTRRDPAAAVRALGVPGAEGAVVAEAAGMRHLLVATEAPIDGLRPDLVAVADVTRTVAATTMAVVRRLDDRSLHVRVFAPGEGIPEDPGTGAAAGPIATFARQLWGTEEDVTIHQGAEMGRPCRIEVHAEEGAVRVGGRVTACASGRFTLSVPRQ
jgi:PhzF family phenazine biosynthesis protein